MAKASVVVSFQNQLQEQATDAAVSAMGKMLWSIIETNPQRPCSALSETELGWLAVSAISGWVIERARQAKALSVDAEKLIEQPPELTP